jgi:hypothetical protein
MLAQRGEPCAVMGPARIRERMATSDDIVKCTKCGSTQIHAEKRGWKLTTGPIGSGKIYITPESGVKVVPEMCLEALLTVV